MRGIEGFAADADAKLRSYKEALSGSRAAAQGVRMSLKEEGLASEAAALSRAAAEAAEKLAVARKEIETQKQSALKSLRADVAGYAKDVAHKVLSRA